MGPCLLESNPLRWSTGGVSLCSWLMPCCCWCRERVPADIRKQGGVARMSDPQVSCCRCRCTRGVAVQKRVALSSACWGLGCSWSKLAGR